MAKQKETEAAVLATGKKVFRPGRSCALSAEK